MKVPAAFFEVSPIWAKNISEAKTVKELNGFSSQGHSVGDGADTNIQNFNTCIVGEAHHFQFLGTDAEKCKECNAFSMRFGDIMAGGRDATGNRKKQLMQNIEDFTNHWRQEHNPLLDMELDTEPVECRP